MRHLPGTPYTKEGGQGGGGGGGRELAGRPLMSGGKSQRPYIRETMHSAPRGDIKIPHSSYRMTKTCWGNIGNLFVKCMRQVTICTIRWRYWITMYV